MIIPIINCPYCGYDHGNELEDDLNAWISEKPYRTDCKCGKRFIVHTHIKFTTSKTLDIEKGKTYCNLDKPDFFRSLHARVIDIVDGNVLFQPVAKDGGKMPYEDHETITCTMKEFEEWAVSVVG